ncbi:MAG: DUF1295 domain-containing protein [Spirochaetales bacterium]|nr:MAG: DUF1295 domain-containing protein [Spirochaetales bacterium]
MHPVLLSLLISLGINAAFFVFAALRKTDVVTDLSYSLSFAAVVLMLVLIKGVSDTYRLMAAAMVIIWAARLGSYLLGRILVSRKDHRFDGIRDKPLKFAGFWILQAITVAIVLVPVSITVSNDNVSRSFSIVSIAGAAIWLIGMLLETTADAQKSTFKRSEQSGFMKSGLWSWSRHPNYFGEMLLWAGVYIYCLPELGADSVSALVGPVWITTMLLFVSGIPLLEKAADGKYGGQTDYEEYKRKVSIFLPWPPKRI